MGQGRAHGRAWPSRAHSDGWLAICTSQHCPCPSCAPTTSLAPPRLQRCTALWGLVAEAEALRDGCSLKAEQGQQDGDTAAVPPAGEATVERVEALQKQLAGLRGGGEEPPSAVWMRASNALLAGKAALAG